MKRCTGCGESCRCVSEAVDAGIKAIETMANVIERQGKILEKLKEEAEFAQLMMNGMNLTEFGKGQALVYARLEKILKGENPDSSENS